MLLPLLLLFRLQCVEKTFFIEVYFAIIVGIHMSGFQLLRSRLLRVNVLPAHRVRSNTFLLFFSLALCTHRAAGFQFSPLWYGLPWICTAAAIGCGHVHPHYRVYFLVCVALLLSQTHICMHPVLPCFVQTTEHVQGLIMFVVCAWTAFFSKEWMTLCIWGKTWSAHPPRCPQRWTANCHQVYWATQHPFFLPQHRHVQFTVAGAGQAADVHPQCHHSRNRLCHTRFADLIGRKQKCLC
jgi:hypothetical protein